MDSEKGNMAGFIVQGGGTALCVTCGECKESFCWGGTAMLAQVDAWARNHQCGPAISDEVLANAASAALAAFKGRVADPAFYPWAHATDKEKAGWRAAARAAIHKYLEEIKAGRA